MAFSRVMLCLLNTSSPLTTEKKVNLYRRHEETAHTAQSGGGEIGVQELVKTFEAKTMKRTGSASPAASTGAPSAPAAFFPGKVKPPPPNVAQLAGMPGYASSRLMPPPPKGEAPKPPAAKVESPMTPPKTPPKMPPKEGTSAPPAPEVPKAVTTAVEAEKEGEPAKKKAALASAPAAVPAASSAAAFLEPVPKIAQEKAKAKEPQAPTAVPPSGKPASKSLCQSRSLALKAMTNLHKRKRSRSRGPSRSKQNNVSDVLLRLSKVRLSVMFVG